MSEDDVAPFVRLLEDAWALWPHAKPLTAGQATMFFRAVSAFSLQEVRTALDAHTKDSSRGRFPPTPADLIAQIENGLADDGRPGPEEAWSIALQCQDEAATIVWTAEIAEAWGVARVVMQVGDKVGAHMAFKEKYQQLVESARQTGAAATWTVSLGHDAKERDRAIAHGQALGRLPLSAPTEQPQLLEGPEAEAAGFGKLMGNPDMPLHVRERLLALRDRLSGRELVPDSPEFVDPGVQRTVELQRQANERVAEYIDAKNLSMEDLIATARRLGERKGQ